MNLFVASHNNKDKEKAKRGIVKGLNELFKQIKNLKKFKIIDQISGIKYKEYFINNTNKIILKALPTIKKFSSKKRIELAIDLLFICQGYRIFKYYNHQKKFKKYFKLANLYSTPKKIHLHIQKRILG